jgi:hypothetical protein
MLVNSVLLLATSAAVLVSGMPTLMVPRQATPTTSTLGASSSSPAASTSITTTTTSPAPTGTFTTTQHITIPGQTNDHVTIPGKTIDIAIPTCKPTITPDENGYVPPGECGAIWNYYPSFTGAVALAVIFFLLTAAHIFQAAYYNKVRKCFLFPVLLTTSPFPFYGKRKKEVLIRSVMM